MKINTITIFLASLALILTLVAWTSQPAVTSEPRFITVTGDADVRVVPDEVILTLGVETWHEDLAIAKERNDARVKAVIALERVS